MILLDQISEYPNEVLQALDKAERLAMVKELDALAERAAEIQVALTYSAWLMLFIISRGPGLPLGPCFFQPELTWTRSNCSGELLWRINNSPRS